MALTYGSNTPKTRRRLGELILYIAEKCAGDHTLGATKLNKILWFSDFVAFARLGQPITGARYQKLAHGPAPRHLLTVRETLETSGDALVRERPYRGRTQVVVEALRPAATELFSQRELELVDEVISKLRSKTGNRASQITHQHPAWKIPELQEDIPYEATFLAMPTKSEIKQARLLARGEGWLG